MKCLLIALFVLTTVPQLFAQDWYFAGTRIRTDEGVINKQPTIYGYSWIRKDDQKTANIKLYKEAAKQLHKSATTTFLGRCSSTRGPREKSLT